MFVNSGYADPSTNGPTIFSFSNSAFTIFTDRGNSTANSLKNGAAKSALHSRNLLQLAQRELRLRQILLRHLPHPFFPQQRQMHRRRQRAQRLIRADIRSRLLPADVLFPRRQASAQTRGARSGPSSAPPSRPASAAQISPAKRSRRQTARHNSAPIQSSALPSPQCPLRRAASPLPSETASVTATTSSAPAACAASASGARVFDRAKEIRRLHHHRAHIVHAGRSSVPSQSRVPAAV